MYVGPDSMRCQAGQQDVKLVVEPAGSIEGKVVAEGTEQPVAGAKLLLEANRPGFAGGAWQSRLKSAADGMFRIADVAAGSYNVRAWFGTNALPEWVAEIVPVTVEAGKTASDVKVTATHGGFAEVAVLGKNDRKPIADAAVNAFKVGYQGGAASGPDGLALLRLPVGEYGVSVYKDNARSEGKGQQSSGPDDRLEIELNPPPKITGVVRDSSGHRCPIWKLSDLPKLGPKRRRREDGRQRAL